MDEKKQKDSLNFEQTTEVVKEFSEDVLKSILYLEKKCFPKEWQYENPYEYFKDALTDAGCINIILKEGENIVGYLLSTPLEEAFKVIKKHDSLITNDLDRMYLDNIEIISEARGRGGSKKMIELMCRESNKRGFYKFSIHARTVNGLGESIKRMFNGSIEKVRKIEHWYFGGNEPYEYIEWIFRENNK